MAMKYTTASDHGIVAWFCLTLEQISGGGITGEARLQYYQINFRENFINSFDNFVCPCQLCAGCRVTRTLFIGVNTAEAQCSQIRDTKLWYEPGRGWAGAQIDGCSVAIFLSAPEVWDEKGAGHGIVSPGPGTGAVTRRDFLHGDKFHTWAQVL